MLTYTPLYVALLVPVCSTFQMIGAVLFSCFSTRFANHAWSSSSSGSTSSTTSSTTSAGVSLHVSVLVILPSGVGVIVVTFPHRWDCVIGLPRCAVRRLLLRGLMADAIGTTNPFFVKDSFFFVLF